MSFWNSETLRARIPAQNIITPYSESQIAHGAYELLMGPEAFITSTEARKKTILQDDEPVVIPPGQFSLLLTEERVKIPLDTIALISMRFSVKSRGLINVSGFHVDPGFEGRLKFSVYNAGSKDITLSRGDRVFMIWLCELTGPTADGYRGHHGQQEGITSEDQNRMHGEIASPGQLKKDIEQVEHFYKNNSWVLLSIFSVLVGILARLLFMAGVYDPSHDVMIRLREELKSELRQELREELSRRGLCEEAGSALGPLRNDGPSVNTAKPQ
jgi:dCTP deaminase